MVNKAFEKQLDFLLNVAILGTEPMDLKDLAVEKPRQYTRWMTQVGRNVLI